MSIIKNNNIDVTERTHAFETMARSYARSKGYKLSISHCCCSYFKYRFSKDNLEYSTYMDFENYESDVEIYIIFDRVIKRVEEALEVGNKAFATYAQKDVENTDKLMLNSIYGDRKHPFVIKNIVFNDPATIIFWADGTKTVVKCQDGESYDPEKGIAMAISKKALGNKRDYYHTFLHWLKKYDKENVDFGDDRVPFADLAESMRKFAEVARKTPFFGMSKDGD